MGGGEAQRASLEALLISRRVCEKPLPNIPRLSQVRLSIDARDQVIKQQSDKIAEFEAKLELLTKRGEEMGMGAAKRMVQMWHSKCLASCFSVWRGWASKEIEDRVKMSRYEEGKMGWARGAKRRRTANISRVKGSAANPY